MMRKILNLLLALNLLLVACNNDSNKKVQDKLTSSFLTDVKLILPDQFTSNVFAQNVGNARHIAVNKLGDVFVNLGTLKNGKGLMRLKDKNFDGVADDSLAFGNFTGTGIAIKNNYLYASSDEEVFRFKLDSLQRIVDPENPERIVTGLISRKQHETKSLTLDNAGNIYVSIGAYSNACQERDRSKGMPGMNPCPILDSAGGIWIFRADRPDQGYNNGLRYATGLRNVVGLDWNTVTNSLFVMQHGRDQLHEFFPDIYTQKQGAILPAECMFELRQGDDCGWPYTYYDQEQHKKIIMPEYGGDGKQEADNKFKDPVVAFPGHLAPNGLLFYTGDQFPAKYKNGAFIAFHGSWNRAPEPQAGFFVAFVPFKNGKPIGKWEIFADNFSGGPEATTSGNAKHRPCGLAMTHDGSLLVTDDKEGTIWKISYTGNK